MKISDRTRFDPASWIATRAPREYPATWKRRIPRSSRVFSIAAARLAAVGDTAAGRAEERPNPCRMPGMDGISATRQLLANKPAPTRVIVLTTFDVDSYIYDALRAGASGFLLKKVPPEELIHAIRFVAAGEALLDPAVTLRVIEEFSRTPKRRSPPPEYASLTDREREVLHHIARGLSNAELAARLYVSEAPVKTHVARLLAKLRLRDRVQAVVYAYDNGIVTPR